MMKCAVPWNLHPRNGRNKGQQISGEYISCAAFCVCVPFCIRALGRTHVLVGVCSEYRNGNVHALATVSSHNRVVCVCIIIIKNTAARLNVCHV